MKLIASCHLERPPRAVARSSGHDVLVLSTGPTGSTVDGFDRNLSQLWSRDLEHRARQFVVTPDAGLWLSDETGAFLVGPAGDATSRVGVAARDGLRPAGLAVLPDGTVFAWQDERGKCSPVVERVRADGSVVWSTTLPVDPHHECDAAGSGGAGTWRPTDWLVHPGGLPISDDAVLAAYFDYDSGLGMAYVLSLSDGVLRYATARGPLGDVASLGGGEFVVGYSGYDDFHTLRYDRSGRVADRWASQGYFIRTADQLRVIESSNSPERPLHLARLDPGGHVESGARLTGNYTSAPVLGPDGVVYFFRDGMLFAAQGLDITEQVTICPATDRPYPTNLVADADSIYLAYWSRPTAADTSGRLVRIGCHDASG